MSNITVPELGESVVEARVAKWLKKEGDRVAMGEPLVELETEKIDLEVSADRPGVLDVDQASGRRRREGRRSARGAGRRCRHLPHPVHLHRTCRTCTSAPPAHLSHLPR